MIIVKLKGGLGNQLLQYATALNLAQQLNCSIYLDTSFFNKKRKNSTPRDYELHYFNITAKIMSVFKLVKYKILFKFKSNKFVVLNDKDSNYSYPAFNYQQLKNKIILLDGYFANPKYFNDVRSTLIEQTQISINTLNTNEKEILNLIQEDNNSVSVHIRRGDYSKSTNRNVLQSITYYKNAIDKCLSFNSKANFYFFSDDINWVENEFNYLQQKVIVSMRYTNKNYLEMFLMSSCRDNIISNSTFSWWSAWLNQNVSKKVLLPKFWFNNIESNKIGLVLNEWIIVDE